MAKLKKWGVGKMGRGFCAAEGWGLCLRLLFLSLVFLCGCQKNSADTAKSSVIVAEVCSLGGSQQGIFGGQNLATVDPLAQHMASIVGFGKDTELCSAVIIGEDLILSAAHCVFGPAGAMKVVFSNSVVEPSCPGAQYVREVEMVRVHENYQDRAALDNKNDIALFRIKGKIPLGFKPVPLIGDMESIGSRPAQVAGFGVSSSEAQDYGVLKTAQISRIYATMIENHHLNLSDESSVLVFDQTQGHGICLGDSGGGAFLKEGDSYKLIGIASIVANTAGAEKCRGVSGFMNVRYYQRWIRDQLGSL